EVQGSAYFQDTVTFNGNIIQSGHGVNGLGDSGSMLPNAGFEVNRGTSSSVTATNWTFERTTGTPSAAVTDIAPLQGDYSQEITATAAQTGSVVSACVPVTGGQTYTISLRRSATA